LKESTVILRETLRKRNEIRRISYWEKQIPERCPPVLWFGDQKRKPSIVTVGLNPSHGEFFRSQDDAKRLKYPPPSDNRFYVYGPEELINLVNPTSTDRVIQSYDEYFKKNPYTKWFGKPGGYNVECFITALDASFYGKGALGCVHIDLFPFVTVDKFSDLDKERLLEDVFRDSWFANNFTELVDYLDPQYLIVFGRSTTEYFNNHFDGNIRLTSEYRENGKKYASYGISNYTINGKTIQVIGLSVNLGNPRGFTKTNLTNMGINISNKLENKPEFWKTLGFLNKPIKNDLLTLALSHHKNHELAQIGDAVLSLVIREHYYPELSKKEIQDKNEELGNNDYLAKVFLNKLNLKKHIISKSGLKKNPKINEVYARIVEAIIGAIYQENGLEETRAFVEKWIISKRYSTI
jgi:23S rRNA maturation mini-RNase III